MDGVRVLRNAVRRQAQTIRLRKVDRVWVPRPLRLLWPVAGDLRGARLDGGGGGELLRARRRAGRTRRGGAANTAYNCQRYMAPIASESARWATISIMWPKSPRIVANELPSASL